MRLIVFDMDGTLVDSAAVMVQSARAAYEHFGQTPPDDRVIRSISGLSLMQGLATIAPDVDVETHKVMAEVYRQTYRDAVAQQTREHLFEDVEETLRRLHADPSTLLAVATGKAYAGAERVLNMHGLFDLFVSVETPDHNPSKPHPGMLYSAMDKAGVGPGQTVMIGDTTHDMDLAAAAKVRAIGVSFGYHTPEELRARGALTVIDRYSELEPAVDATLETQNA